MKALSILTVCYNSQETIGITLDSLPELPIGCEWVIVDGGSTDGTLAEIYKREGVCDIIISEPDDGLYNAINKGLRLCTGEFVMLLHAGDRVHEHTFRQLILEAQTLREFDCILYGVNVERAKSKSFVWIPGPLSRIRLWLGWMAPHVGVVIRRDFLFSNNLFYDETLKIAADYEWERRVFKETGKVLAKPEILQTMAPAGLSSNVLRTLIEDVKVARQFEKTWIITVVAKKIRALLRRC